MAAPTDNPATAAELLKATYQTLGFDQGALVSAARTPQSTASVEWIDRGDWQALAAQVGAESIFFVDRDPVVVFAKLEHTTESLVRDLYERIWCMSRPQLLFLATPGQISAYDLTKPPPKLQESLSERDRLIAVASSLAEVQSKLGGYHRERIETGAAFGDTRFRTSLDRADRALIRDLKIVRQQLAAVPCGRKKPRLPDLHSLIGRAIFIRYLEDRGVLLPAYFEKVAAKRKHWTRLISQPPQAVALEPRFADLRFLRVLQDKDFTYALFEQLARDFNGDTFPIDDDERDRIQQAHLDKLRGFLTGSTSDQENLFFFAYRFDVIPIELISTIYEEFYNERTEKDRNQGSHYTPPALVEFVLAHTLTAEVLAKKPRVMDPACGSGIFIVESFRRIVRHLCVEQGGRRVSRPQLRKILRDQIAGIDINEEAVRVAAFSLYLAYLHYQEPREINDERRLPYLKWVPEDERCRRERAMPEAQFFDVLLHANSFELMAEDCADEIKRRFGPASASVVVGNPPWGSPRHDDTEGRKANAVIKAWCNQKQGRPVGDGELSQAFIHLTNALLVAGGRAGLLVSSGVLFKHHENSREFRRTWLESARLEHIVNFAHVRYVFFSGAQREAKGIAPFISVVFEKTAEEVPSDTRFQYWSAKRTAVVENTRSIVLNRGDMHWLSQRDCLENDTLWKIYWWGGHRDELLVRRLEQYPPLSDIPAQIPGATLQSGRGFEATSRGTASGWLKDYSELPATRLTKYGRQPLNDLRPVPARVYRKGLEAIYSGHRLLVGRGIKTGGHIVSRLEHRKYCFRNSIHGVRFKGLEKWHEATIAAVFWSSLARYYYFTTSGSWGLWHDEIHLEHVKQMPLRFPRDAKLRERIVRAVEELQKLDLDPDGLALGQTAAQQRLSCLERELDDAVFDLYQLNSAERDLVREMCDVGLDLFYQNQNSAAVAPVIQPDRTRGTFSDVCRAKTGLAAYLRLFLECWQREFGETGQFTWRVLSPPSQAPLLAICFTLDGGNAPAESEDAEAWRKALARLAAAAHVPAGGSRVFIDTFFRHVSDREILFIKRNERRFWTRTAAREDAESTMTYLMNNEPTLRSGAR